MINELKLILDGLEAANIDISPTHKTLTKAGGKEAVRVILDRNDANDVYIKRLEYMDRDDIDAIWVIGDGNKNHFPDIKLTRPLVPEGNAFYADYLKNKKLKQPPQMADKDFQKLSDKKVSANEKNKILINSFNAPKQVNFTGVFPGNGYRQKIEERYQLLSLSDNPKVSKVAHLFELFINFDKDGHGFLKALDEAIHRTFEESILDENFSKLMLTILFGNKVSKVSGDLQGGANDRIKLVIDYQPNPNVDIYATNADVYKNAISRHLVSLDNQESITDSCDAQVICPIYGKTHTLVKKTFPKIKTNTLLGNVTPYARFDNSGKKTTVHRYHRSGTDAYSVDKDFSNKLDSIINLLTSPANLNKTWRPIASENPDQNDVLIAFCHEDSDFPALKMLSIKDYWDHEGFKEYSESTEEAISLIKAKHIKPNGLVSFIILRKVDTANQKVVFSAQHTVSELVDSTNRWKQAVANTPDFKLIVFINKEAKRVSPWSLSPEQLVRLSKNIYQRDGEIAKASVPAISFTQTMRLFFDEGSRLDELATQSLQKICRQTQWLFNLCATHRVLSINKNTDTRVVIENKNALMYTTLISLLLYKLNRTKEQYMASLSYQLGQFCSAMNELHLGYCDSERSGSVPSTLLGSAAYSIALKSPNRALDYLANRLTPYASWVKHQQATKDKDGKYKRTAINSAVFAHNWMQQHSQSLFQAFNEQQGQGLSKTHTAELMLGYLAGRDFEKKTDKKD